MSGCDNTEYIDGGHPDNATGQICRALIIQHVYPNNIIQIEKDIEHARARAQLHNAQERTAILLQ